MSGGHLGPKTVVMVRSILCASGVLGTVLALAAASSVVGPDVDESSSSRPDAGPTVKVARPAKGDGTVQSATGATSASLVGGDVVDMFLIYISNPSQFSVTVSQPAAFDTQLFVFKVINDQSGQPANAQALYANDDAVTNAPGGYSKIVFPAGTNIVQGVYAIAIAPKGIRPYSYSDGGATGGPGTRTPFQMFTQQVTGLQTPISNTALLKYWDGNPVGVGAYTLAFTGSTLIPLGVGANRCGDVFSGDCFVAHTAPACDDEICCRTVCNIDAYCCTTTWDANCALVAQQNCENCSNAVPPSCPGDLDSNGAVDGGDLGAMLSNWGQCN